MKRIVLGVCMGFFIGSLAIPVRAALEGAYSNFQVVAKEDFYGYETGAGADRNGIPLRDQNPTNDGVHRIGWKETNWVSSTAGAISDDDLWPAGHSGTPVAILMANDVARRPLEPGIKKQGTTEFWASCFMRNAYYGGIEYYFQLENASSQAVVEVGFAGSGVYQIKAWDQGRAPHTAATNSALWNAWFKFTVRGVWEYSGRADLYFWFSPGAGDDVSSYHASLTNVFIGSDIKGVVLRSPNASANIAMFDDIEVHVHVSDLGTVLLLK